MNRSLTPSAIPLVLAAIAVDATASPRQGTPIQPILAQGKLSTLAVGMTIQGVSTPVMIRAPGVNGGTPTPWTSGAFTAASQVHPNYSTSALTAHWAPGGSPAPKFGGISTGGEVMPSIDSSGHVLMSTTAWFVLAITVDASAPGEPGSIVEMQRASGRDPSGDILSYYASGSQGIHTALVDTVRLESSRAQLGLDDVLPAPPGPRSIENLDYGLGIVSVDPQDRAGTLFPVRDCFYFTLSKDWLAQAPGLVLDGQPANASTVYGMHWTGSPSFTWSAPVRAFTHDELFDTGVEAEDVEIDALSVDRGAGTWDQPDRVILSLTPASDAAGPFDQILVHQRYTTPFATTLLTDPAFPPSQPFSRKFGLVAAPTGQPTDVECLCGLDPDELYVAGPVVAIATDQVAHGAGTLGFSGVRTCGHSAFGGSGSPSNDDVHLQVTGMSHRPHTHGFVQLFIESAVATSGPPGPATAWGAPIWITPAIKAANAIDVVRTVPCALVGQTFRVSAQLYGAEYTPGLTIFPLRESWVLSIGE